MYSIADRENPISTMVLSYHGSNDILYMYEYFWEVYYQRPTTDENVFGMGDDKKSKILTILWSKLLGLRYSSLKVMVCKDDDVSPITDRRSTNNFRISIFWATFGIIWKAWYLFYINSTRSFYLYFSVFFTTGNYRLYQCAKA